jgi:hypothetical protein
MEPGGSLTWSQEPSIGPYPKLYESSPYYPILFLRSILILSSHLCLGPPSGLFRSGFITKTLYALLHYACYKTMFYLRAYLKRNRIQKLKIYATLFTVDYCIYW